MNPIPRAASVPSRGLRLLLLAGALLVGACQRQQAAAPAIVATPEAAAKESGPQQGLKLDDGERERLGVRTTPAEAATARADIAGYAVVLGHDVIAQAVAEVTTAEAALRQSQAALARTQRLAGTPGAYPAESLEAAERQSTADAAVLQLAQRRLATVIGTHPPWGAQTGAVLTALAGGTKKLVRVSFPIGTLGASPPRSLRLRPLGGGDASWLSNQVWEAPADASVPGQSLFALLGAAPVGEGERLQASVALGPSESGVIVPAGALVAFAGQYWCYVEKPAGHFVRVALDPQRQVEAGYFVTRGLGAGDAVVTTGAGLLLAREQGGAGDGGD